MADEDEDVYDFEIYGDNGMSYLAHHPTATTEDGSPVMVIEWRDEKTRFHHLSLGEEFKLKKEFLDSLSEPDYLDQKKLTLKKISTDEAVRLQTGEKILVPHEAPILPE